MTALELYKFVNDNDLEFHYENNEGEREVLLFVDLNVMKDFVKLIDINHIYDGFINCVLTDSDVCVWMNFICEFYDITLEEVFGKDDELED